MRVLVVESDCAAADDLTHGLRRRGYTAHSVDSGMQALTARCGADLVLLDLELPDLDGLEVCRAIRAESDVPLIALTARGTELDRVLGLQAGADDYLVKPYGFAELMARLEAVMRRARPRPMTRPAVSHGPLHIDSASREVSIDGRQIIVTRKEFDFLHLLASHPETVFTRKQIMSRVWDTEWTRFSRTIDTHVGSLRKKLGGRGWIITVRGVGFRFGGRHEPKRLVG